MKTALVLSGGGMFGAWQAGAWRALAPGFQPDLVVGASVGSLNGYLIAAGWHADDLCNWWSRPESVTPDGTNLIGFKRLPQLVDTMIAARPLERDYSVVIVDALRMKPVTVTGTDIKAEHLLASCAVPGAFPPQRIQGLRRGLGRTWYVDGGLLNPLPMWVAAEQGATRIVGMNVLAKMPSAVLAPFVKVFRAVFGHNPPLPGDVEMITLTPSTPLGSMRSALVWQRENAERWIAQGTEDVCKVLARGQTISILDCFK